MRMEYDDAAWERSDNIFEDFKKKIVTPDVLLAVTNFMSSYRDGVRPVDLARIADVGGFNLCFRMVFEDGFSSLLRFPCPGRVMLPEEKVRNEVAIMTYLKENTNIPVPRIIHHGMAQLRVPGYKRGDRPILDPDIGEEKLEFLYGQLADILLELSKPSFDKIGSLAKGADGWDISNRPLTMNMNELVQLGNFPPRMLPQSPFSTASSYYQSLEETEFMHLKTQRNDAIDSEDDCRSKYIARGYFVNWQRRTVFTIILSPIVVASNSSVTTSVLPMITHSPSWWLLLEMPEEWPRGISDWSKAYKKRLETFLLALKRKQDAAIESGHLIEGQRLSGRMRESWDNGDFWINYGARKSWAFDVVWPMIDGKFFGGSDGETTQSVDAIDREEMGPFIHKKLEDSKRRILDNWD
ncbi:Phosphotransferase enzyme family [Aspergillus sclerotialis]|uniref:Phosphotransferase enzyme family n=1 Tax=Aspergillus sclerotialis TaxID=2070753 RepID=A0A3A2ZEY3_9EURO|nr:Phosphotransferase enzyme family [Aspergillus sclerotialis]